MKIFSACGALWKRLLISSFEDSQRWVRYLNLYTVLWIILKLKQLFPPVVETVKLVLRKSREAETWYYHSAYLLMVQEEGVDPENLAQAHCNHSD